MWIVRIFLLDSRHLFGKADPWPDGSWRYAGAAALVLTCLSACSSSWPAAPRSLPSEWALPQYVAIERVADHGPVSDATTILFTKTLPEARNLVVLVHGWSGDSLSTWAESARVLAGRSGDEHEMAWTRAFNILLYGYPTATGGRELERQARILISQIQLAITRCSCTGIYLVAHSMGSLIVTRSLADLLFEKDRDRDAAHLLSMVRATLLIAPAFQLTPRFEALAASFGWGQLGELAWFSEFRLALNNDLRRLRQTAPQDYVDVFGRRTILLLAGDDAIVDNGAVRSQFRDLKVWELPGDHTEIVKMHSPNHETFQLISRVLRTQQPASLIQVPSRVDIEVDIDTGRTSHSEIFFGPNDFIATIILRMRRPVEDNAIEVSTTNPAHGFFAQVWRELAPRRRDYWIIKVLREPFDATDQPELLIFVDRVLAHRLPIRTALPNRETYKRIVDGKVRQLEQAQCGLFSLPTRPRAPRIVTPDWMPEPSTERRDLSFGCLTRELLGEELVFFDEMRFMAPLFLDYVAFDDWEKRSRPWANPEKTERPMTRKWLGIAAAKRGDYRGAYTHFQRLSQVDPIGVYFSALTLGRLGQLDTARAAMASLPEVIRHNAQLQADCVRLFGEETVRQVITVPK